MQNKREKDRALFQCGWALFLAFWKKETSEFWILRWIFRAFFDNFRDPKNVVYNCKILEIRPCGLGSRIRDMEAKWRLKVITDLISWIFGEQNWRCGTNRTLSKCAKVSAEICFRPLTASTTSEVKNDYAHAKTRHLQQIHCKFIEIQFSVRCMVWVWCWI